MKQKKQINTETKPYHFETYTLNPDELITIEGKTYEVNIFDGKAQSACSMCSFFLFPLECICHKIKCIQNDRFLYLTEIK